MQAASDSVTSTAWGGREGGGRRDGAGETAGEEEKGPGRSVKPQREACGDWGGER